MARYLLVPGGDASSAGTGMPQLGGQSGCTIEFTADTLVHAQTFAQNMSSEMQRRMTLVQLGVVGPYTTYDPAAAGASLTTVSGISF